MADMGKKFVQISKLKIGSYVLIDDSVCQIKAYEKSKPGKHGAAKARITAIDIFTGQKRGLLKSTGSEAEVPIIQKSTAQVVAVMGDRVQLMDTESYETFETAKPKDVSGLASGIEVEYHRYGPSVKIVRKKN